MSSVSALKLKVVVALLLLVVAWQSFSHHPFTECPKCEAGHFEEQQDTFTCPEQPPTPDTDIEDSSEDKQQEPVDSVLAQNGFYVGGPPQHSQQFCNSGLKPACTGQCKEMLDFVLGQREASSWNIYYHELAVWLTGKGLDKGGSMVEVGIAYGGLSSAIMRELPQINYHSVDPFIADYDTSDLTSATYVAKAKSEGLSPADFSLFWAQALNYNLKQIADNCPGRFTLHHMTSTAAAGRFNRHSVDVVMIDGLHTRAGVDDDIEAWIHVVKPGGYLLFNDYGHPAWPGVTASVVDLAKSLSTEIIDLGHSNVAVQIPSDRSLLQLKLTRDGSM
jgi:SAM-dependent methyltransferase